ncbi:MAG: hypothetical protein WCP20_11145 [Desulfuromonadales bacterium]
MTPEQFEKIWIDQVGIEKSMLLERAAAYATNGDRLGNFYEGAKLNACHPLQYGFSLVSKHIIALRDLIEKIGAGQGSFSSYEAGKFNEYVTDIRNYAVLIQAIYSEASNAKTTDR